MTDSSSCSIDVLNSSDYKCCDIDDQSLHYKSICVDDLSSSDYHICNEPCKKTYQPCQQPCPQPCPKPCTKNYQNPDLCTFKSLITPLSQLTPVHAKCSGPVEFTMRRKNKVVSLQWEPFTAVITTSGIAYLSLAQTLCNLPQYPVSSSYTLSVNGVFRQAQVQVNTCHSTSSVWFYLNADSTATGITANDSIVVNAACINWIVA